MTRLESGLRWGALVGASLIVLSACNPALNWRQVRFDDQAVKLLLPCKPDQAERQVDLGGVRSRLRMMGCEAQGLQFTWARLDLPLETAPAQVLRAWQQASLLAMGADPAQASRVRAWSLSGARVDLPPALLQTTSASGTQAHFVWWAVGAQAHQLAVYSERSAISPAIIQTLQEGVQLP